MRSDFSFSYESSTMGDNCGVIIMFKLCFVLWWLMCHSALGMCTGLATQKQHAFTFKCEVSHINSMGNLKDRGRGEGALMKAVLCGLWLMRIFVLSLLRGPEKGSCLKPAMIDSYK